MNSVSVMNGYIVETAMPASASSARATAESLLRPALDAPYAAEPGNAEKVIPELTLTMLPEPCLSHDGEHRLHGDQRRDEVQFQDGAEVIRIDLLERRVEPLTGDVAQDVDPSERIRGGAHGGVDLAGIGDVTADGHRAHHHPDRPGLRPVRWRVDECDPLDARPAPLVRRPAKRPVPSPLRCPTMLRSRAQRLR